MFRSLALLLIAMTLAAPAMAFSPEGATAPVTNFGGRHGFSFGIFGVDTMGQAGGQASQEERPLQVRAATAGLTWTHGGWSVGVSGGQMQYVIPGVLGGSAPLAGITIGREVTDIAGGTLAAEFRGQRLYGDGSSTDILGASLRWSLKF